MVRLSENLSTVDDMLSGRLDMADLAESTPGSACAPTRNNISDPLHMTKVNLYIRQRTEKEEKACSSKFSTPVVCVRAALAVALLQTSLNGTKRFDSVVTHRQQKQARSMCIDDASFCKDDHLEWNDTEIASNMLWKTNFKYVCLARQ